RHHDEVSVLKGDLLYLRRHKRLCIVAGQVRPARYRMDIHGGVAMNARGTILLLALATLPACNPYTNFDGEFFAGPVDATLFPAESMGKQSEGATSDQGGGAIAASTGWVRRAAVPFYKFTFKPMVDPTMFDALTVEGESKAYVFDPSPTSALPHPGKCKP